MKVGLTGRVNVGRVRGEGVVVYCGCLVRGGSNRSGFKI